ncbi:MAG: LysR family transcriptional regulator, partial [Clostridia bacterium]|nr:LysR family transcriptional regulator [Clostridia bacterium]
MRYFYESACTENITKTAERHLVPPSSVSLSIKRLETELGCTLFDRSGNRIRLNDRGRALQKALEIVLGTLDSAVEALTVPRTATGDIYLLVRSERQFLLDCISEFRQLHPDVVFHLSHDFAMEDIGQFDIIIDDAAVSYAGFQSTPLVRENIRIAAAAGNPLCSRELT